PMDSWWPNGVVFPLSPSRQSWTTSARAAARFPTAWFAAFVPSGIIHAPSLLENGPGATPVWRDCSMSLLWVALRLILGVHICVHHASRWTRVVWGGLPEIVQQLHPAQFLENDATEGALYRSR